MHAKALKMLHYFQHHGVTPRCLLLAFGIVVSSTRLLIKDPLHG